MHESVDRPTGSGSVRWAALIAGLTICGITIVIGEYFGERRYIRPFGSYGVVLWAAVYVYFKEHGAKAWFWLTMVAMTAVHIPLLVVFAERINRASPIITILVGMLDGIVFVFIVVLIGAWCDKKRAR